MTVRIRMEQTIARGITTDVRARGRYFSGFCWAMHRVVTSPTTADLSRAEQRELLEGMEEILALASYRRRQTEEPEKDGISGITGRSNITDDSLYETDTVDLSSFTLLDNTPYAIRRFQSTLGNFYLKQGTLELTAAGTAVAKSLEDLAGPYFEQMVEAVRDETVSIKLLDELADAFTHQGSFTSTTNDREQDTLQRILLGVVEWDDAQQTVAVRNWPSELALQIQDHYEYIVSGEHYSNNLRDAVGSQVHQLRRAWCLAILRAHELTATTDRGVPLAYDDRDQSRFEPFRPLARVYYLQGQLAHALRTQLWGLTAHLSREAPEGVPRAELLAQLEDTPIAAEIAAVRRSETTLTDERLGQGAVTRELLVAGEVTPRTYEITVPETTPTEQYNTLGEVRDWLQSHLVGTWRPTTDNKINGQTLIEATEACYPDVEGATSRAEAIDALGRLIARSTLQLVAAVKQYTQLLAENQLLKRYVEDRFGQRYSSLPRTAQFLEQFGPETSVATVARQIFDERVMTVHDYVVQDRLGSGSISLAFGTGADASEVAGADETTLFAAGGAKEPGTGNLRYRDLRRLMRDAGLLTYQPETGLWVPTADGTAVLARFRGIEA